MLKTLPKYFLMDRLRLSDGVSKAGLSALDQGFTEQLWQL